MISSRLTGRDSLLFVYGTLRPFVDIPIARRLRKAAHHVGHASTSGRLYDLGAYPGITAARRRGERVCGDLYRVSGRRVLRELDRYERGPARGKPRFVRERCTVKLARGTRRRAWLYRYRHSIARAARIGNGDYRLHCQMNAQ